MKPFKPMSKKYLNQRCMHCGEFRTFKLNSIPGVRAWHCSDCNKTSSRSTSTWPKD